MDSRIKIREIRQFIKAVQADYRSSDKATKKKKKSAILKTVKLTLNQIWGGVSALFVYPIWYTFRKKITEAVYEGTSWEVVHKLVVDNKIKEAKEIVQRKGMFLYWLWTYGDLRDPLGRGELPEKGYAKFGMKNNFFTRYYENAIRNPRFTINYIDYRSGTIVEEHVVMDTRDFDNLHSSEGIGANPIGILFKWVIDESGEWYFIYDDNNTENLFYFGYSGLGKDAIGKNGRFEIGYRSNS